MKYLIVFLAYNGNLKYTGNLIWECESFTEEEYHKIRKLHTAAGTKSVTILNVIPLDEPVAVEALMQGDCTACGAYQPDDPYPYQCELQGKISEGGCDLWHPKGVLEDD